MKWLVQKIETFTLKNDVWIFIGAILLISLFQNTFALPYSWGKYLYYMFIVGLYLLPVLVFEYQKPKLKNRLSSWSFIGIWISVYLVYLFLAALIMQTRGQAALLPEIPHHEFFPVISLIIFWLAAGVEANTYLIKKLPKVKWIQQLNLDKAILIILLGMSLLLSAMAVSNLEQFRDEGLIYPSLDFTAIISHPILLLHFTWQFLFTYLAGYFFYFINKNFLVPILLRPKGILIYLCSVILCTVLFYPILAQLLLFLPISQNIMSLLPSDNHLVFDPINGLIPFCIMIFSVPIILVIQWFQQNNKITTLEKEKATVELGFLKQQINPHFFFNTLNNLYALSLKKSNDTPEVILQLSELMRYVIYKGKEQLVPLSEEVNYIQDYINLQQIRLHKSFAFKLDKQIDKNDILTPPLLLIILVENAFKHGIEPAEQACFININIRSDAEEFIFQCENSFEESDEAAEGIGLNNLRRRLLLRYPDRHTFQVERTHNTFKATLKISLP